MTGCDMPFLQYCGPYHLVIAFFIYILLCKLFKCAFCVGRKRIARKKNSTILLTSICRKNFFPLMDYVISFLTENTVFGVYLFWDNYLYLKRKSFPSSFLKKPMEINLLFGLSNSFFTKTLIIYSSVVF